MNKTNKEIDDAINQQLADAGIPTNPYKEFASSEDGEQFSVCQFFPDGTHEYVRRFVTISEAFRAAEHYTQNVSASVGITQRVIITDGGDCICFEWIYGQGVVFPDNVVDPQRRDYSK